MSTERYPSDAELGALYAAADNAIKEGDYEPHPERYVDYDKLAKPRLIRAMVLELRSLRAEVAAVETVVRLQLPENDQRPLPQRIVAAARNMAADARASALEMAAVVCESNAKPSPMSNARSLINGALYTVAEQIRKLKPEIQ